MILKIRVNRGMGEDAVIGKAQSKLFARVLERIQGEILPESTDVDLSSGEIIDATPGKSLTPDKSAKPKVDPYEVNESTQDAPGSTNGEGEGEAKEEGEKSLFERLKGARTNFISKIELNIEEIKEMPLGELNYLRTKWEGKTDIPWPLDEPEEEKEEPQNGLPKELEDEMFYESAAERADKLGIAEFNRILMTQPFNVKDVAGLPVGQRKDFLKACDRKSDEATEE